MRRKIVIAFTVILLLVNNVCNIFANEEIKVAEGKLLVNEVNENETAEEVEDKQTENSNGKYLEEEKSIYPVLAKENRRGTSRAIVQSGIIGTVNWTLDDTGELVFSGGVFPDNYNWFGILGAAVRGSTKTVTFTAPITAGNSLNRMFANYSLLTTINGLEKLNTENVTNMFSMFNSCSRMTSLDLHSLDTRNVVNMSGMFNNCTRLVNLDLSTFNTSNVTNMYAMFYGCSSLTTVDLSDLDTENVRDMGAMFSSCTNLTNLDLSSFNTSNVTDMSYMFIDCKGIESLDLSSFDTSNVQNMASMFYLASIKSLTLGADFRFKFTNHQLEAPFSDMEYSGNWELTSTKASFTQGQFLAYDGTKPGTYIWERTPYNVTYNSNGGSIVAGESVPNNSQVTKPTNPTKEGYTFDGWYKEASLTNEWNFLTDLMPTNNITLYAKWNINSYNVTYDTNGGSAVAGETVEYNSALTQQASPTKTGYTFDGWYKEAGLVNKWNFITDLMPANNITLYAKWNINLYNVTYDANGGSAVAGETVAYNSAITEPVNPTKTGYTFAGWYKEAGLTNEWDFTADLMSTSDITLYAKWNINSYNVTYDTKGGSAVAGETVEYNSAVTEPANPTKEGYTFDGWYKEANLTIQWNFVADLMPANDTTLHAKWKAIEYQITYDLDGGTNSINNPATYKFATGVTTFKNPTKDGYKFLGWFESANGGTKITSISTTEMGDKTLFARWEKIVPTVVPGKTLPGGRSGNVNKYNKKSTNTGDLSNLAGGIVLFISSGSLLIRKRKRKA